MYIKPQNIKIMCLSYDEAKVFQRASAKLPDLLLYRKITDAMFLFDNHHVEIEIQDIKPEHLEKAMKEAGFYQQIERKQ